MLTQEPVLEVRAESVTGPFWGQPVVRRPFVLEGPCEQESQEQLFGLLKLAFSFLCFLQAAAGFELHLM